MLAGLFVDARELLRDLVKLSVWRSSTVRQEKQTSQILPAWQDDHEKRGRGGHRRQQS